MSSRDDYSGAQLPTIQLSLSQNETLTLTSMAEIALVTLPSIGHCSEKKSSVPVSRFVVPAGFGRVGIKIPSLCSRMVLHFSVGTDDKRLVNLLGRETELLEMSNSGAKDSIENHGVAIDEEKTRVRCKHCGKEVGGFSRLKQHLGGIGNDVAACKHVPADIMEQMRDDLQVREVGDSSHTRPSLKRNISSPSSEPRHCQPRLSHPESSGIGCLTSGTSVLDISASVTHDTLNQSSAGLGGSGSGPILNDNSSIASRFIGKFFYEAGIDLNAIKLPSFQKMMEAAINCGSGFKVPKFNELGGWILQEEMGDVQKRVQDAKQSWGDSGCSILLDVWTDQRGRSLMNFLVDCPQDTIFLRSVDASNTIGDTDALVLLLSGIIEEVGVHNVVQVMTHDPLCYLEAAGKKLVEKYKTVFWTVCADHCISLILERIESMDHVKQVLAHAKHITRFIYSHPVTLELMGNHIFGGRIIRTSFLKSVVSFITLENMVSQRENLLNMFTSRTWSSSTLSSIPEGKLICELVKDSSFWAATADILKVSNPLVSFLRQINGSDAPQMGFLYDSMDKAKEEIQKNLRGEEAAYLPYWTIIDEIWDEYLHSPLHSTAYYLNPSFFYSDDFFDDVEVTNDLLSCVVRMTGNQHQQERITSQLYDYKKGASGGFASEMAVGQCSTVPPVKWWSLHGGQVPELQKLAIKLLSQTCCSVTRYKLRKGLSEQLHSQGSNVMERQRLSDLEFVHNNLRLWQSSSIGDPLDNIGLEDLTPLDDWTVENM